MPRKIILAITGATGAVYGVRLLEELRNSGVETHLVVSRAGALTISPRSWIERGATWRR